MWLPGNFNYKQIYQGYLAVKKISNRKQENNDLNKMSTSQYYNFEWI